MLPPEHACWRHNENESYFSKKNKISCNQPLNVPEILSELEIKEGECYNVVSQNQMMVIWSFI